ncbi:MAG: deoxyribodipyrimidine photo-lyase [bacterium]
MKISVSWLRRDLRLEDNHAIGKALASGLPIMVLFIFDENILKGLPVDDPRVTFIFRRLEIINSTLIRAGSSLLCLKGNPVKIWEELVLKYDIAEVFLNGDYEPYALERDQSVEAFLTRKGIKVNRLKDQVIFEKDEIQKEDGSPYTVFTPYKRKWLKKFRESTVQVIKTGTGLYFPVTHILPSLCELGFRKSSVHVRDYDLSRLDYYGEKRNFPAEKTTQLGPHLRFGTVSIRQVISWLDPIHEVFLGELIWREFFMQILFYFPKVVDRNFNYRYNGIEWKNDEIEFKRWCTGETGYPLVDAGMRELNSTGYMHNRVRMVVAGFLCKHLLIDWRWGEAYFSEKLVDYELSSNNGNWQWAAGTGCDAAPYFRVFNPTAQMMKFDKRLEYVRTWVPEYGQAKYPEPIVQHNFARERAIAAYKACSSNLW